MNERVRSLAMQNERIWNLYTIGPVQRAEVEQFVEAIIQECIDHAFHSGDDVSYLSKHFGVEK